MAKAPVGGNTAKALEFVRGQVATKLTNDGMDKARADALVQSITAKDLEQHLGEDDPVVMKAGIGTWIAWLRDHKDEIKDAIETIYTLLSLFSKSE